MSLLIITYIVLVTDITILYLLLGHNTIKVLHLYSRTLQNEVAQDNTMNLPHMNLPIIILRNHAHPLVGVHDSSILLWVNSCLNSCVNWCCLEQLHSVMFYYIGVYFYSIVL